LTKMIENDYPKWLKLLKLSIDVALLIHFFN
jgi:hypothetical protein